MIAKFRAWDKRFSEFMEDFFVSEDGKIYKKSTDTGYGIAISRETSDEVILMQSTGLKDKDGQEIFEGDIVKRDGVKRPEVVRFGEWTDVDSLGYKEQYIGFYFESEHEGQEWLHSVEPQFNHLYKVIGNIYENQELLEVENET